jgi:uncharacterized membrane protein
MDSTYPYWTSTGILALFVLFSGVMYFVADGPAASFDRLGFPDYFRVQLGIAKIVGGMALLAPLPRWLKEWTYAGFAIDFVSALIAHLAVGDPLTAAALPLIALTLLLISYVYYHRHVLAPTEDSAGT